MIRLLLCIMMIVPADAWADRAAELREALLDEVDQQVQSLMGDPLDPEVRQAMESVPRHALVDASLRAAYENRPLPIGHDQTISQPFIVALMTDLLELEPGDRVLEIGTGSGYQAAVLAEIVDTVHTIEIIEPLGKEAARLLAELGYDQIETRIGDGYFGWPEAAPFDAIIVTAAATHVPPPLVQQLKPDSRMVIPVGSQMFTQHLMLIEKDAEGEISSRQLMAVRFVPLTGAGEGR